MPKVYAPSEDTFLLAQYTANLRGQRALEIGIGSGYLTSLLAKNFIEVIGTDVDLESLLSAKGRIIGEGLMENVELILCSGAQPIFPPIFDVVVFNPPYLPSRAPEDTAVNGGEGGTALASVFLHHARNLLNPSGKVAFVLSSLSDWQKLVDKFSDEMQIEVVGRRRLFFEELLVIEAKRKVRHEFRWHHRP